MYTADARLHMRHFDKKGYANILVQWNSLWHSYHIANFFVDICLAHSKMTKEVENMVTLCI